MRDRISPLGAKDRSRASEIPRLPRIPVRAAGSWGSGRLAGDTPVRHRAQSASLARLAGPTKAAEGGGCVHRRGAFARRANRVRAVVHDGGGGGRCAPRVEAEHDRAAAALSGGVSVRHPGTDAAAYGPSEAAILACLVHQQYRERDPAELVGAMDQPPLRMVAEPRRWPSANCRHRRCRDHHRALRQPPGTAVARVVMPAGSEP